MENKQEILDNLSSTLEILGQLTEKYTLQSSPADFFILDRAKKKLYDAYYLIEQK